MAPAKRNRPAFSPPRPGKSKSTSASAKRKDRVTPYKSGSKKRTAGSSSTRRRTPIAANKRGKRARVADDEDEDEDEEEDEEDSDNPGPRGRDSRSALALVDMQAGIGSDEDDREVSSDEDNDNDNSSEAGETTNLHNPNSSPEPDMILAEITVDPSPLSTTSPIPQPLVHRLLSHHFENGAATKISVDARDLVSRYLEVFVREAVMRSAFERDEREGGDGSRQGVGGGFLEVEDLERAAVQLCLDF